MAVGARVLEHNLMVYRRVWHGSVLGSLISPVLFLAAMGIGLGGYVNRGGAGALGGVSYLAFLAPGLLAAQAMQTAAFETTYPIMGKIVWDKLYDAMLATPLTVRDLLAGELEWLVVRLTIVCSAFLGVAVVFGAVRLPLGLLALPVAVLTGLGFAAPIMAFSATQRQDSAFNVIFRFGITPLFLLSGTFFPLDRLPAVVQPARVPHAAVSRRRAGPRADAGLDRPGQRRRPCRRAGGLRRGGMGPCRDLVPPPAGGVT